MTITTNGHAEHHDDHHEVDCHATMTTTNMQAYGLRARTGGTLSAGPGPPACSGGHSWLVHRDLPTDEGAASARSPWPPGPSLASNTHIGPVQQDPPNSGGSFACVSRRRTSGIVQRFPRMSLLYVSCFAVHRSPFVCVLGVRSRRPCRPSSVVRLVFVLASTRATGRNRMAAVAAAASSRRPGRIGGQRPHHRDTSRHPSANRAHDLFFKAVPEAPTDNVDIIRVKSVAVARRP